ncbi:MAG: CARDB domain-containing protein [Candidatus Paceibacterota bacterium]|jgi:hypothetical protein
MEMYANDLPSRQAATHGLAIVGFIALIGAGMWLAIYSTQFVPSVVGRMGAAAVYLGSVFTPAEPTLSVIDTASTTIPFGDATSTPVTDVSENNEPSLPMPVKPVAGAQTTSVTEISGSPATLSGLPDLSVTINQIGYLATTSASSFVASSTVPVGSRPAVSFTVKNVGTNASGAWRFSASIPTQTAYVYQSPAQQALAPGDSIDYTLGFDQAISGTNKVISITANFDSGITESSKANNTASTSITILGS